MYLRASVRKHKGKTYRNYLLVESVPTPKGPRQRTVCSLGTLGPQSPLEWLQLSRKLESALLRHLGMERPRPADVSAAPPAADSAAVQRDSVATEFHREIGPLTVGLEFFEKLGIREALRKQGAGPATIALVAAMVLHRLLSAASFRVTESWPPGLEDQLNLDIHAAFEHKKWTGLATLGRYIVSIERTLAAKVCRLFRLDPRPFFYQLISPSFPTPAGETLPQAEPPPSHLLVLAVNHAGLPVAHFAVDTSAAENPVRAAVLELHRHRGIEPAQVLVVSKQLLGPRGVDATLRQGLQGLHLVFFDPDPNPDTWTSLCTDREWDRRSEQAVTLRLPGGKRTSILCKIRRRAGESALSYILPERVEPDRRQREREEGDFRAHLAALEEWLQSRPGAETAEVYERLGRLKQLYPRPAAYLEVHFDPPLRQLSLTLDPLRKSQLESLDGGILLRSDWTDLPPRDGFQIYLDAEALQSAFLRMGSPACEAPVWDHSRNPFGLHFALCAVAYNLLFAIQRVLLEKGSGLSWSEVCEILKTHQACSIVFPQLSGVILRLRKPSIPEPAHQELYRLLDVVPKMAGPQLARVS